MRKKRGNKQWKVMTIVITPKHSLYPLHPYIFSLPYFYTVEPPNKGHIGIRSFVLYREVSFIRRLKCTGIIGIGMSRFVLYREVFFIRSVLYQRFHCIIMLPLMYSLLMHYIQLLMVQQLLGASQ